MRRSYRHIGICLVVGALAACSSTSLSNSDSSAPAPGADSSAPAPSCPTGQEPIDGKITDADRMRFEATSGSMTVIIMVEGGAQVGPLPECPADRAQPCPARDGVVSQWETENLASQSCVRALIASTGGTADPTTLWLVNAFTATLTWEQIQVVAAHPQVIDVESNGGTPPP